MVLLIMMKDRVMLTFPESCFHSLGKYLASFSSKSRKMCSLSITAQKGHTGNKLKCFRHANNGIKNSCMKSAQQWPQLGRRLEWKAPLSHWWTQGPVCNKPNRRQNFPPKKPAVSCQSDCDCKRILALWVNRVNTSKKELVQEWK